MKRVVASVLVLLGWAVAARAAEYKSFFGFTSSVPDGWLVLTKQSIKDNPAFADTQDPKDGKINPEQLKDLKAKIESGSFEMLYDRTTSDATFATNINVRVGQGTVPSLPEGVKAKCEAYGRALAKYAGRNLAVAKCESRPVGTLKGFYVEYEGVVAGTVTMQYQILRPDNSLLLVTATCKQASLDKVRTDFEGIVRSIRFV